MGGHVPAMLIRALDAGTTRSQQLDLQGRVFAFQIRDQLFEPGLPVQVPKVWIYPEHFIKDDP